MKRDVQFVQAIDASYESVRDLLRERACWVLCGSDEPQVSLEAHLGGTEITREMDVEIVAFDEPAGMAAGAHLLFRGDASKHPDLFPHLEARLDAVPISEERTALFLVSTYKPPLGVIGGAIDSLGLHRFAEESLHGLFTGIAERLGG